MTSPPTQVNSPCCTMENSSPSLCQSLAVFLAPFVLVLFKEWFPLAGIFAGNFLIQFHSQAGAVGYANMPILNDRFWNTIYQFIPERHIRGMELEHQEIRNRGAKMCGCQSSHRAADV